MKNFPPILCKKDAGQIFTPKKSFCHLPLVSVIIPSYNHSDYLSEAIESVQRQTYQNVEIVVVDDGSTDNTKEITAGHPQVKYVFQENQGLSTARNTGIANSSGELLVFLDADDLLYPDAIEYNCKFLEEHPEAAFVSGASLTTTLHKKKLGEKKETVTSDHYVNLLKSNYIGMHGTVTYRRKVFQEFKFDPSLKACEDYEMYLKVARKYAVAHHTKTLAVYRRHGDNMSRDIPLMLSTVLEVLCRQERVLRSEVERRAYEIGKKTYKIYYTTHLYYQLRISGTSPSKEAIFSLKKNNFWLYLRYLLIQTTVNRIKKSHIKKFVPPFLFFVLYKFGWYKKYIPEVGKVKTGDFFRTTPFSKSFGYDRGGPIDRYYIENFLLAEIDSIHGWVLEIGDNEYTLRFGKTKVQKSEILHVDQSNPQATIVGDLSRAPHIPDNSFDCIILTQTLHLVYDHKAVVQTCYRILKPGGTLLLTVPGITPIDYGEWRDKWLWSFTGRVVEKILEEYFSKNNIEVNTYGNVYVASAFLYGMGLPEIKKEDLDYNDPHMQVMITAKAVKR